MPSGWWRDRTVKYGRIPGNRRVDRYAQVSFCLLQMKTSVYEENKYYRGQSFQLPKYLLQLKKNISAPAEENRAPSKNNAALVQYQEQTCKSRAMKDTPLHTHTHTPAAPHTTDAQLHNPAHTHTHTLIFIFILVWSIVCLGKV